MIGKQNIQGVRPQYHDFDNVTNGIEHVKNA
jgi:hypothetical protein